MFRRRYGYFAHIDMRRMPEDDHLDLSTRLRTVLPSHSPSPRVPQSKIQRYKHLSIRPQVASRERKGQTIHAAWVVKWKQRPMAQPHCFTEKIYEVLGTLYSTEKTLQIIANLQVNRLPQAHVFWWPYGINCSSTDVVGWLSCGRCQTPTKHYTSRKGKIPTTLSVSRKLSSGRQWLSGLKKTKAAACISRWSFFYDRVKYQQHFLLSL